MKVPYTPYQVSVDWHTPYIDDRLAYIARVSNPDDQDKPVGSLFKFMMREGHSSPFDMCNVCLCVNAPRDISRQAIRHSSIKVQEFSQRYKEVDALGYFYTREFRAQHPTNRQLSLDVPKDDPRHAEWERRQKLVLDACKEAYAWCLENGGAKEVARTVLPEGLTPSRLFFNGTMRSWIFYLRSRLHRTTQKEHRWLAESAFTIMLELAPLTMQAFFPEEVSRAKEQQTP